MVLVSVKLTYTHVLSTHVAVWIDYLMIYNDLVAIASYFGSSMVILAIINIHGHEYQMNVHVW